VRASSFLLETMLLSIQAEQAESNKEFAVVTIVAVSAPSIITGMVELCRIPK
jgi:hypothetical protein